MSVRRARAAASENFYVSLNDVLVGILFLFIMLLMTYALNFKKRAEKVDQVFVQRVQQREDLLKTIETRMNAADPDHPRAMMIANQGILRLPADLLFETNQSALKPRGQQAMHDLARILADELPCYGAKQQCPKPAAEAKDILEAVYVEGHTDEKPKKGRAAGTDGNWELSSERAIAAYRALIEIRQADHRSTLETLKNARGAENLVGVSAYAATRHLQGATDEQNRRVDFRFILSAPDKSDIAAAKGH